MQWLEKLIPLLGSKKGTFAMTCLAAVVAVALSMDHSDDASLKVKLVAMGAVALLGVGHMIGQGLADMGKEEAKIKAEE